jgi:predicted RNA binding protein YcfA (HicA-like mRNA interferase family)
MQRIGCTIVKSWELIRLLEINDWTKSRQAGSHVTMTKQGKRNIIVPVHSGKDINKGILYSILKIAEIQRIK